MKILYLGPKCSIYNYLKSSNEITQQETPITVLDNEDWIISFNYRHIITSNIVDKYKCVNLHISYLPFNRGVHPNFWAWIDDTISGVTLHWIDAGIDTGKIIDRRIINHGDLQYATFRTTHAQLLIWAEKFFIQNWRYRDCWKNMGKPQEEGGSFHTKKDIEKYWHFLPHGWDTKINNAIDIVGEVQRELRP